MAWPRSLPLGLLLGGVIACGGEVNGVTADVPGPNAGTSSVLPPSSGGAGGQGTGVSGSPTAGNGPTASGGVATANGGSGPVAGTSSTAGGTTTTSACTGAPDTAASVLRRLSRVEYQLTLQELLQLPAPPAIDDVPPDSDLEGFRTVTELQNVSPQHLRAYSDVAAALSAELMADTARRTSVVGCDTAQAACLSEFIGRFGRVAYRRALAPEEVDALVQRASVGVDAPDRFRIAIESLLVSPSFLFRVELGDQAEGLSTLTRPELASRLSFTLLGRGPSVELLDRADQGALDTPEGLTAVALEMLADPRTQAFYDAFFQQWLRFEQLLTPKEPPPGWSDALLTDMTGETQRLVNEFAWTAGAGLLDSLTANHSYLTPGLAAFYGVEAPAEAFGRVEFPAGHARANTGLLTHAALISAKSDGDMIAKRGKWVRNTFLCEHLEVPDGLLEEIQGELSDLSYEEILARRNSDIACAGCHSLIDPVGVGFSQFDPIGSYDASVDIASYGIAPALSGSPEPAFASLAELAQKLKARPEVAACVAQRAFLYTAGRDPEPSDACAVERASQRFAGEAFQFRSLLLGLVEAPSFRLRRAPDAAGAP